MRRGAGGKEGAWVEGGGVPRARAQTKNGEVSGESLSLNGRLRWWHSPLRRAAAARARWAHRVRHKLFSPTDSRRGSRRAAHLGGGEGDGG